MTRIPECFALTKVHGGIIFDPVDSCSHVTPFGWEITFDPDQKCFFGAYASRDYISLPLFTGSKVIPPCTILYRFHASLILVIFKLNNFSNASKAKYMTEEANEKKANADSDAVGLTWNRDTGIECYEEEYLLKAGIKTYAWSVLGAYQNNIIVVPVPY